MWSISIYPSYRTKGYATRPPSSSCPCCCLATSATLITVMLFWQKGCNYWHSNGCLSSCSFTDVWFQTRTAIKCLDQCNANAYSIYWVVYWEVTILGCWFFLVFFFKYVNKQIKCKFKIMYVQKYSNKLQSNQSLTLEVLNMLLQNKNTFNAKS